MTQTNPLKHYFRQPAIHVQLPSKGRFYPEGALDLPATGEIPVYPMTLRDEITIKTPDAMLNGSAVAEVIASCCPNIRDPWSMPMVDLDTVLIAIRIASYGIGQELQNCVCPSCAHEHEYTVDLSQLISQQPACRFDSATDPSGLTFRFKPHNYHQINQANRISFEQKKILNQLTESTLPDEQKIEQFKVNLKNLTDLNIGALCNFVASIETPDGDLVTDQDHIREFIENTSKNTYDLIKDHVDQLLDHHRTPPAKIECPECHTQYELELTFDQSNFFDYGF